MTVLHDALTADTEHIKQAKTSVDNENLLLSDVEQQKCTVEEWSENRNEHAKVRIDRRRHSLTDMSSSLSSSFNPFRFSFKCSICLILSWIGLICGFVLFFMLDPMIKRILARKLAIVPGQEGYRFWKDPPANIHRKMYIWHCVNPIEVQQGAAPELIELGPYVYREQWNRSNVFYTNRMDILSYIPITTLYFDRSQSVGPDDQYVTVINVPLMAMAHQIQFDSIVIQDAVNLILEMFGTSLFVNVTVKQLMEGYTDPLIEMASKVKPGTLKDGKFGILQPRNGSYYQNFSIHTGIHNVDDVAKVVSFNGLTTLNYWSTPEANMLNGTDGSLFPPNLSKDKKVYSYNADMCRSYYLTFLRQRKDGLVTLYDFHLPSDVYNMSRPENRGFCGQQPCLGDGVLNISTCYLGVWGFISSPHFFQADEKFRRAVHGMQPDSNKHEFIMSFDPITSVPFAVNVRLQLSFYLPRVAAFDLLKTVTPTLVPIVWFDDEARITSTIHSQMTTLLVSLQAAYYMKFILPTLSFLFVLITSSYIFVQWHHLRRERANSKMPLLDGQIDT